MTTDEQQIRDLIAAWLEASKANDTAAVLRLMTDDVVFMVPGRPPFGKAEFAEAARAQSSQHMQIEGDHQVLELQVLGDWAFMRAHLQVTIRLTDKPPVVHAGNTLTLFRRQEGRWLLARDANLLVPRT